MDKEELAIIDMGSNLLESYTKIEGTITSLHRMIANINLLPTVSFSPVDRDIFDQQRWIEIDKLSSQKERLERLSEALLTRVEALCGLNVGEGVENAK